MDTKHTPGEWAVLPEEVDRSYIRIRGTVLGGRYKIANVLTPVYDNAHEREAKQTRANARLIAAAPDLLGFAQAVVELDRLISRKDLAAGIGSLIAGARAAIAKATQPEPTP